MKKLFFKRVVKINDQSTKDEWLDCYIVGLRHWQKAHEISIINKQGKRRYYYIIERHKYNKSKYKLPECVKSVVFKPIINVVGIIERIM